MTILVGVWGGPQRLIHMARFIREVEEALVIARRELGDGYLVNLRTEVVWGSEQHSWQAQVQRFLLAMASVRAADEVERSGRFKCSGPLRLVDSAL